MRDMVPFMLRIIVDQERRIEGKNRERRRSWDSDIHCRAASMKRHGRQYKYSALWLWLRW